MDAGNGIFIEAPQKNSESGSMDIDYFGKEVQKAVYSSIHFASPLGQTMPTTLIIQSSGPVMFGGSFCEVTSGTG